MPQAEIITLAWHVDYWDYLGWKDEFASPMFSQRQELYAKKFRINSIYTPQMVVDGQKEFAGNNRGNAVNFVLEAAKMKKAKVEVSFSQDILKLYISEISKNENATVFAIITEDNLTSNVKRGENSGRVLEHSSVVREVKNIGVISGADSKFSAEPRIDFKPEWKKKDLKIVVIVQENENRKILGVNQIKVER